MPTTNVYNKQATFVVRIAKNLEHKTLEERNLVYEQLGEEVEKNVKLALRTLQKARLEKLAGR